MPILPSSQNPHPGPGSPTGRPVADPACAYCHGAKAPRIRLDQEDGPDILTMCLPCLRSTMLMKAALSEQRGVRLLREDAEENGLRLWRSSNAVYLLPAMAPAATAARQPVATR